MFLHKMKTYAFVGPSGTGKSYRAQMVANEKGINYIIDENKNMHEQQCPLWHDCRGGVHYLKSKCDLAEQNLEYHNACDNADKARNALNKFWANKFAHVK